MRETIYKESYWMIRVTNLLVELVDYALCPLQMQVFALQRPVDVGELNAHLTHQQPVVLVGPVDTRGRVVAHLPSQQADNRLVRRQNVQTCQQQLRGVRYMCRGCSKNEYLYPRLEDFFFALRGEKSDCSNTGNDDFVLDEVAVGNPECTPNTFCDAYVIRCKNHYILNDL